MPALLIRMSRRPNFCAAPALEMAIGQRRPDGVIHHSDQGSQYTSLAFGKRCKEAGVRSSMGSLGESFCATLECELLERRRFASQAEAKMACFSFIEGGYNPVRLHSALGYRSPMAYEHAMEVQPTGGESTKLANTPPNRGSFRRRTASSCSSAESATANWRAC